MALPAPASNAARPLATNCTRSWKAAVDGNWTDASKWTPSGVPTHTDDVCITHAGRYGVTLNHSASVRGLTLGGTSDAQALTFPCGHSVSFSVSRSTMNINPTGVLTLGSQNGCAATIELDVSTSGTIVNHGVMFIGADEIDSDANIDNFGFVSLDPGAMWIEEASNSFTNEASTGVFGYYMPNGGAMLIDDANLAGRLQILATTPNPGSDSVFIDGNVNGHFTSYVGTALDHNGLFVHECFCSGDFGFTTTRANVTAKPTSGSQGANVLLHGTHWPTRGTFVVTFKDSAGTTTTLGAIPAKPSGTFDVYESVPGGAAPGAATFTVRNVLYHTLDHASFTVTP